MNKDSIILVTGVKGQLGYDCVRELTSRGYTHVVGIDKDDLDLTNEKETTSFILNLKPEVIMHNAAWTQVDKAEEYKELVNKINVDAPRYIASAAKKLGAKLVYISTDYVFNGLGDKPFEIDDPKEGLSIYGKSKALGEESVIANTDKYFIVRISWAFGINGNNFVKTMLKLAKNGIKEVNVVKDQIGSVTFTEDLSRLLVDMIETEKYGIYHATNEGFISWATFAEAIFAKAHYDVKVNKVTSEEYKAINPASAPRPKNSRLSKASLVNNGFALLPNWEDALDRYLELENLYK